MEDLTFGQQVKLILERKGMTITELARKMEKRTGNKMSKQNLTQRLGRDNFPEQDMRIIAEILGCSFQLNIMEQIEDLKGVQQELKFEEPVVKKKRTLGRNRKKDGLRKTIFQRPEILRPEKTQTDTETPLTETQTSDMQTTERKEEVFDEEVQTAESFAEAAYGKEKTDTEKQNAKSEDVTQEVQGEVNPYTGKEYQTNSVRMHPKRIGYVQVYNREKHKWIDMTEWAFLGYEERKKALLGKAYEPPIYLD